MDGVPMGTFLGVVVLLVLFPTIGSGLAQSYAQKYIEPTRAAVIYTTESVFACGLSVLLGYDALSVHLLLGGALIVGAILVNEVKLPSRTHKEEVSDEPC